MVKKLGQSCGETRTSEAAGADGRAAQARDRPERGCGGCCRCCAEVSARLAEAWVEASMLRLCPEAVSGMHGGAGGRAAQVRHRPESGRGGCSRHCAGLSLFHDCGWRFAACGRQQPCPTHTLVQPAAWQPSLMSNSPLSGIRTQSSNALEVLEAGVRLACVGALFDTSAQQCAYAVLSGPSSGTSSPQVQVFECQSFSFHLQAMPQATTYWLCRSFRPRAYLLQQYTQLRLRTRWQCKDQPGLSRACPCSAWAE